MLVLQANLITLPRILKRDPREGEDQRLLSLPDDSLPFYLKKKKNLIVEAIESEEDILENQ